MSRDTPLPVTGERQCTVGVRTTGYDAAGQFETEPLKAPFVRKEYADALRARIVALYGFVYHGAGCPAHENGEGTCDCGLSALLDRLRDEGLIETPL